MPGPVPKRSEVRRYRGKHAGPELVRGKAGPAVETTTWPEPLDDWHPTAASWYESLQTSGQSQWYEMSDVWTAVYAASLMSAVLHGGRGTATIVPALNTLMDQLLTTEGARRRARVELERGDQPVENPLAEQLARYRKAAEGG